MTVDQAKQEVRDQRAARVRVARAHANLRQSEVAEALGQSVVSIKRMEAGQRDITIDDLWAIADLCNVPREFMTEGFNSVPSEIARLHERFDMLTERLGWDVAHVLGHAMMERMSPPRGNGGNGDDAAEAS